MLIFCLVSTIPHPDNNPDYNRILSYHGTKTTPSKHNQVLGCNKSLVDAAILEYIVYYKHEEWVDFKNKRANIFKHVEGTKSNRAINNRLYYLLKVKQERPAYFLKLCADRGITNNKTSKEVDEVHCKTKEGDAALDSLRFASLSISDCLTSPSRVQSDKKNMNSSSKITDNKFSSPIAPTALSRSYDDEDGKQSR